MKSLTRHRLQPQAAHRVSRRRQAGLTLIELMVALVLGLLVAGAAIAALLIARTGFTSVDNTAQLRENARFASSLIQRIVVQAGFENAAYGQISVAGGKDAGLSGFNNANFTLANAATPPTLAHDSRSTGCGSVTDTSCVNGSDILVVRFWGASRVPGGTADGSMINCAGEPVAEGTERAWSIFHVVRSSSGEPTLACTFLSAVTGWTTRPLVSGVESFQVLYGLDTLDAAGATGTDSVADFYRTAQQVDGAALPGAPSGVTSNWQRVRTVRIGMVIRGNAPNTVGAASTQSVQVLGAGFSNNGTDPLSVLTAPADGRLRQNVVFTVHLRNMQYAPGT